MNIEIRQGKRSMSLAPLVVGRAWRTTKPMCRDRPQMISLATGESRLFLRERSIKHQFDI
jgi:hypothetical protein